jgi:double-stranded uracil-DNA glycosylase
VPGRRGLGQRNPDRAALEAARGGRVPDVITRDLDVLFCGINPSLYSAAVRHHFARPGNRFWPAIHGAGFTRELLVPAREGELLHAGIGITNVVPVATASADELSREEYRQGVEALRRKLARYRPRTIAFLGLGAYRLASGRPGATIGLQPEPFAGVVAWALPNPSGLNAHYQLPALIECYAALARAVGIRAA